MEKDKNIESCEYANRTYISRKTTLVMVKMAVCPSFDKISKEMQAEGTGEWNISRA